MPFAFHLPSEVLISIRTAPESSGTLTPRSSYRKLPPMRQPVSPLSTVARAMAAGVIIRII